MTPADHMSTFRPYLQPKIVLQSQKRRLQTGLEMFPDVKAVQEVKYAHNKKNVTQKMSQSNRWMF